MFKTNDSFIWCLSMEQPLSDIQILSHIQLLSSEHLYTLKQIHNVNYERKLLGGDRQTDRKRETDRQTDRQRQRASGFRVTACSHCSSETYVLHPSVPSSSRVFSNACANAAWYIVCARSTDRIIDCFTGNSYSRNT